MKYRQRFADDVEIEQFIAVFTRGTLTDIYCPSTPDCSTTYEHDDGMTNTAYVSFESRTAQMSALFHISTCAFCLFVFWKLDFVVVVLGYFAILTSTLL